MSEMKNTQAELGDVPPMSDAELDAVVHKDRGIPQAHEMLRVLELLWWWRDRAKAAQAKTRDLGEHLKVARGAEGAYRAAMERVVRAAWEAPLSRSSMALDQAIFDMAQLLRPDAPSGAAATAAPAPLSAPEGGPTTGALASLADEVERMIFAFPADDTRRAEVRALAARIRNAGAETTP